eukprot:superscaffoldBa00003081_g16057
MTEISDIGITTVLLAHIEYEVDVELNVTDVATVDYLRSLLNNSSFSLTLGPTVNVTHIDITTVCYPNGTSFQCRCEDQFVWSYKNCMTYGACDDITDDTCRCINAIPSDGQYCQPKTVPPVVYEYQIFIEVNTTDADQLRNTMENITFPIQISTQINISDANITTVCHQDDTGFQCRCEDNYLWPCDKQNSVSSDNDFYTTINRLHSVSLNNTLSTTNKFHSLSSYNTLSTINKLYNLSSYNKTSTTNKFYNLSCHNTLSITNKLCSLSCYNTFSITNKFKHNNIHSNTNINCNKYNTYCYNTSEHHNTHSYFTNHSKKFNTHHYYTHSYTDHRCHQ